MNSLRPVYYATFALIFAILAAIYGLMTIEGMSFIDALWLAVTSISTVGFGDKVPSTTTGRIIVMALIFCGVGLFTYLLSAIFVGVTEGHIRNAWGKQKMFKRISKLKDHIVVCGAGRVGQAVIKELMAGKQDFVVIEKDQDRLVELHELSSAGRVLFIAGDATEDRVLLAAGTVRSKSIITTLADDAGNLMITIACKDFNPNARVVARANRPESMVRLKRAGADTVVCPSAIAGNRMALASLKPASVAFVQTLVEEREIDLELEELVINENSPIAGMELKESRLREKYGVMLLAIKRGDENIVNPEPTEKFQPGDVLILSGPSDKLTTLEKVVAGVF